MSSSNSGDPPSDRGADRRAAERVPATWAVDCETPDTFLYASIANISELGIFVRTTDPLAVGTLVTLRFAPPNTEPFNLQGIVQWINFLKPNHDNPNPGMGVRFVDLSALDRERLIDVIKTIAYLREGNAQRSN